jgi:tetratricopeptide (TPR) repeat protein
MPEQVKKTLVLSIYFALTVSALLVFWQVCKFDFVSYDDNIYVFENQHVLNGITGDGIIWAFTTGFAAFWHPLTWLSLMLDCQLFGPGPGGFHLVNVFFHLVNTLLLFAVLKKMTGSPWPSAFAAALFALHPLHVESVAWIAERKDILSTSFWLLAMLAYARYVKKPNAANYLLTLLTFALGLMAKPMLVTLPFVFLLLDYWPLCRIKGFDRRVIYRLVLEKIPFIVLAIASSVIAFFAQQSSGAVLSFNNLGLKFRIGNALISYVKYIEKMFWPSRLSAFYPYSFENVSVLYAIISAAVLLAITILVIRFTKNHRYLFTGWFWYLGTLVPVIGLIQVGEFARADRYTYITLTGLFIIIAWGVPELLAKLPQRKFILGSLMLLSLTALGITAHRQASYWKNSFKLFSHMNEVTKKNYFAYNGLGYACDNIGRRQDAIESYKQAIKIRPSYAYAYNNLGVAYGRLGRHQEAIEACKEAIKIRPDYAEAHYNLGVTYGKLGRRQEAIEAYKQAIKIKPNYADAYYNLGDAYGKLGRGTEAIEAYTQAIKINPDDAEARSNLGAAYISLGRYQEAIEAYKQTIKIKPDDVRVRNNLSAAYLRLGRYQEAIKVCKEAIRIKPDDAEAYSNLCVAYGNLGRITEAIEACKEAIKIKPNYADAHYNLGFAYLKMGDKNSALAEYNILKSLNSELANNLLNQINK